MFPSNHRRPCAAVMGLVLSISVGGCATPMLSVSDVVVVMDGRTTLDAFTEHSSPFGHVDQLAGVEVNFEADGRPLGSAVADARGLAQWCCHLPTDAKMVQARAVVDGKSVTADARVFRWDPDRTIIVCDIDETISATSYSSLIADHPEDVGSTPFPDAADTLTDLSGRYNLIYMTARPRVLLNKTRRWLERHGFPPAPVVTTLSLAESVRAEKYKGTTIADLRCLASNLLIGIGNARTDSEAYAANGLLPILIDDADSDRFRAHAVVVRDWKMIRALFEANREVLERPEEIAALIRDEGLLRRPVIRYQPR